MISQAEYRERFLLDQPVLEAWGRYVVATVQSRLVERAGIEALDQVLKIPCVYRIKTVDSLLAKAFIRGKRYTDPYEEVTDKVGARCVVLLQEHINLIQQIVEEESAWEFSKDRDFEDERLKNPLVFDYQSVHYVLRCCGEVTDNAVFVAPGTACELQIRTLLQHAFSELTHDRLYKPSIRADPEVRREVAMSMALIEATGLIFTRVSQTLAKAGAEMNQYLDELSALYSERVGITANPDEKANAFLVDELQKTGDVSRDDLVEFLSGATFVGDRIRVRAAEDLLFRQPAVLLIYYLARKRRHSFRETWPLPEHHIAPIFTDLGIALM